MLPVEKQFGNALQPGGDAARFDWCLLHAAWQLDDEDPGAATTGGLVPGNGTIGEQSGSANEVERGPFAGHRPKRDTKSQGSADRAVCSGRGTGRDGVVAGTGDDARVSGMWRSERHSLSEPLGPDPYQPDLCMVRWGPK